MASTTRRVLITGATGHQGMATIEALLQNPSNPYSEILAVTRNTQSPHAQAVAAKSHSITLVKGELDNCTAIFESCTGPIHAVFSIQPNSFGSPEKVAQEEAQGRAIIDAAVAHGVNHFVQASGDRGGPENSEIDPTNVPHFATKYNIEKHLIRQDKMTWTILRPVTFMENVTPDFTGKVFASMWSCLGNKPLQLVSTKDIGIVAAKALAHPEEFSSRAISLAGDELTQAQASEVFKRVYGKPMPTSFGIVGKLVQWRVAELKAMFDWFGKAGFKADIDECRKINLEMQDFGKWLQESRAWKR